MKRKQRLAMLADYAIEDAEAVIKQYKKELYRWRIENVLKKNKKCSIITTCGVRTAGNPLIVNEKSIVTDIVKRKQPTGGRLNITRTGGGEGHYVKGEKGLLEKKGPKLKKRGYVIGAV